MVCFDARRNAAAIVMLFAKFETLSGLCPNRSRGILIPLRAATRPSHISMLDFLIDIFVDFQVRSSTKYLGVKVGLDAYCGPFRMS
jgi:hypothetical protein